MSLYHSASQCWAALSGERESLIRRCERYASLTIPKICLPDGVDVESTDQTHDYQSIGAQAVNHLTNKVMLALFRPSAPFFRIDLDAKMKREAVEAGVTEDALAKGFSLAERNASRELDARAQRPKLYTTIRHLIVTGNVLLVLDDEDMRVMGIRYYCVKRDSVGRVHTLIIREDLCFDELDLKVQESVSKRNPQDKVQLFKWIERQPNGDYTMSQWVDEQRLPPAFDGKWPEEKMPYRVLAWDLADESDYGTGLVEEYAGDLEACSLLSEAIVNGAVLGTEFRWMVNPTGMTSADDLNNSKNGDALPGKPEDVAPTQGGNPQAVTVADNVLEKYVRRIAMGFLLQTAVTRDAERVTAEEVRQVAMELETAFGGVYSALANNVQMPVAHWLLRAVDLPIEGTDLRLSIITGLDALSRNGDLENLRLALSDLAVIAQLPEALQGRIKFKAIAAFIGAGRGVDLDPFIKNDDEYAADMRQQQQARVAEASATAAGEAAATGAMQQ